MDVLLQADTLLVRSSNTGLRGSRGGTRIDGEAMTTRSQRAKRRFPSSSSSSSSSSTNSNTNGAVVPGPSLHTIDPSADDIDTATSDDSTAPSVTSRNRKRRKTSTRSKRNQSRELQGPAPHAQSSGLDDSDVSERDQKRVERLLKNRKAAQQSRERKKIYITGLEEQVRSLTTENNDLRCIIAQLRAQLAAVTGKPMDRLDTLASVHPSCAPLTASVISLTGDNIQTKLEQKQQPQTTTTTTTTRVTVKSNQNGYRLKSSSPTALVERIPHTRSKTRMQRQKENKRPDMSSEDHGIQLLAFISQSQRHELSTPNSSSSLSSSSSRQRNRHRTTRTVVKKEEKKEPKLSITPLRHLQSRSQNGINGVHNMSTATPYDASHIWTGGLVPQTGGVTSTATYTATTRPQTRSQTQPHQQLLPSTSLSCTNSFGLPQPLPAVLCFAPKPVRTTMTTTPSSVPIPPLSMDISSLSSNGPSSTGGASTHGFEASSPIVSVAS